MRGFRGGLIRILFVVALGLAIFWPEYGMVSIGWAAWPTQPELVTAGGAIVAILLALVLPISLKLFRWVSTVALAAIMGLAIYSAAMTRVIDPNSTQGWQLIGAVFAFSLFGWLLVATPLWRFAHGIVATEDQHH